MKKTARNILILGLVIVLMLGGVRVEKNAAQVHPFTMDRTMAEQSIARLGGVEGAECIFTAHYGYHPASAMGWDE